MCHHIHSNWSDVLDSSGLPIYVRDIRNISHLLALTKVLPKPEAVLPAEKRRLLPVFAALSK